MSAGFYLLFATGIPMAVKTVEKTAKKISSIVS